VDRTNIKKKRTFPGRYESLEKIRDFVVQAASTAGLNEKAAYEVELAVDEACCNIIDHAYGGEDKGEIECCTEVESDGLQITLKDHGSPFDPKQVTDPQLNVPLGKLKTRGVGLFLMRKMMNEVRYQTNKIGGNIMTLVKKK
jgi:serine/threonine-protein kinase RsbW